jgi:SAM-dependent methyltransferase
MTTRHLDLGCGPVPRNPYGADELYGLDIRVPESVDAARFRQANLVLEPIPFADGHFDSLSAYDFIEHMPRLVVLPSGVTRLPFIELMNEIWRVLKKPGGHLYAVTPAWPRAEAFVDPTHVNVITERTHRYFTEPELGASIYGFGGRFRATRVQWIRKRVAYEAPTPDLVQRIRSALDIVKRRRLHLLWEFEALP